MNSNLWGGTEHATGWWIDFNMLAITDRLRKEPPLTADDIAEVERYLKQKYGLDECRVFDGLIHIGDEP